MEQRSRFLIGIDLGTTNSVVAYIDTYAAAESGSAPIRVFDVPQLVAPGEVRGIPALPSFLYFPTEHDTASGGMSLPWNDHSASIAGVMARDQGALTPGRQVSSAKSWLCDPAVGRRGDILPPDADTSVAKISPIEASARYLIHLRNAWNHEHFTHSQNGGETSLFEDQAIVLTVPASFDAEARELTGEAAQRAGLKNFILLEEPVAAFYAWIAAHEDHLGEDLHDGDLVLICDVGGGTTDFSLVRVRKASGNVEFERTAIGEHLLLGGDNVDVALARIVEDKLGGRRLSARQRHALQRACCDVKERLCNPNMDRLPVTVLGSGRAVVGGALTAELTRNEVLDVLVGGFLPLTRADAMPVRGTRRTGLRELGLHYASDPAITKHLAEFLTHAAAGMSGEPGAAPRKLPSRMERPDVILFNGGFFAPPVTRERIVDAVAGWFQADRAGWKPRVLSNDAIASAVAVGAAYYGRVRRGRGLRIRAGSPRTFYVALRSEQELRGVCVLPFGVQEGTTLSLDREFTVLANRPVSFTLYSSTTRCDPHGAVTSLEGDHVHRHAPLVTLLRHGKKLRDLQLSVRLTASFTEVGTLELWCASVSSPHRWRLQFELRGAEGERQQETAHPQTTQSSATDEQVEAAVKLLRAVFATSDAGVGNESIGPATLVGQLEAALAAKRESWPAATIRTLSDVLLEIGPGRKQSPRHEARWLNLLGFCLRPGFGMPGDDQRSANARKLYQAGLVFRDDLQSQVEWLVLWRRITGGLSASHQHELYRMCISMLGLRGKKPARLNRQLEQDAWRLLASLEQLPAPTRVSLGQQLLPKINKEPNTQSWLWSLGRFGSRVPLYGPVACVIPVETASQWLEFLLQMHDLTADAAFAITLLASRTDDHHRDIDEKLRRQAVSCLRANGAAEDWIQMVTQYRPPSRADASRMFGETLPKGVHFASSANCVLPLVGLVIERNDRGLDHVS
jgi:hypothetical protein